MKKAKKKTIGSMSKMLLLFAASFSLSFCLADRAAAIVFPNWYSDQTTVGFWSSDPHVFLTNLNSSMEISSYLNSAVNKWKNAGISSSITTTPSSAQIKFYSGTKAELNAIGFTYTSKNVGDTVWSSSTTASNEGSIYTVKRLSSVMASACKASNYPAHVVLHEYGHALGWYGHSSNSKDVMYTYEEDITTLTSRDKNQLIQVYNEMR